MAKVVLHNSLEICTVYAEFYVTVSKSVVRVNWIPTLKYLYGLFHSLLWDYASECTFSMVTFIHTGPRLKISEDKCFTSFTVYSVQFLKFYK